MNLYHAFRIAVMAGASAFAVSSCAYDPYSSGYSGVSSSAFISTGNSAWGYDPTYRAYYNYNRRAYYDPYLNGFYPVGYRPQRVFGAPHPYGFNGRGKFISAPKNFRNHNLVNYKNRDDRYRNLGRSWSRDVRRTQTTGRDDRFRFSGNQQQRQDFQRGNTAVGTQQRRISQQQRGNGSFNRDSSRGRLASQQQTRRQQPQRQQQARQQQQRQSRPQAQPQRQSQPQNQIRGPQLRNNNASRSSAQNRFHGSRNNL